MATHSSILAWRIPWTQEPGVLQSIGSQRVWRDWVTKHSTYQFCSVAQSCLTFCYPMDCSTQDFPVHHQLLELTQSHIHWVGDAIQPSHLQLSPSPPAFSHSQHQSLFQCVSSSHKMAKVLEFSFSISPSNEYSGLISFRMYWLGLLAVQGTQESSPTPQFKSIDSSALSLLYGPSLTSVRDYWKNHSFA